MPEEDPTLPLVPDESPTAADDEAGLEAGGRRSEARAAFARALEIRHQMLGAVHPRVRETEQALAALR